MPPRGHLTIPENETFLVVMTTGKSGVILASSILRYKHPAMHVTAPITENDPAPNSHSAKVEESCSKSLPCQRGVCKSSWS